MSRLNRLEGTGPQLRFEGADHLYLNLNLPDAASRNAFLFQAPTRKEAKISIAYDEPVVDDPSEWVASVVRFTAPTSFVPISLILPQGGGGGRAVLFTATATNGSMVLTGASTTLGIDAGMLIRIGAFNSTVVSTSPTSVTMAAPWPNATGVQNVRAYVDIPLQANPDLTIYSATLQAAGDPAVQAFLSWVPELGIPDIITEPQIPIDENSGLPSIPNPDTNPQAYRNFMNQNSLYYSLFSYTHWMFLINSTFQLSFNTASLGINWAPAATVAPCITYDAKTALMTITAQTAYQFAPPTAFPLSVWFNTALYSFFRPGFDVVEHDSGGTPPGPVLYPGGKDVQLLIQDAYNNRIADIPNNPTPGTPALPGYSLTTEFPVLRQFATMSGINIVAQSFPSSPEFPPPLGASVASSAGDPIITDFYPEATGAGWDLRNYVSFRPAAEYTLASLISSTPLQRVSLRVTWTDSNGIQAPLYTASNNCVNMKIMFRRRGYQNPYVPRPIAEKEGPSPRGGSAAGCCGGCASCGEKPAARRR